MRCVVPQRHKLMIEVLYARNSPAMSSIKSRKNSRLVLYDGHLSCNTHSHNAVHKLSTFP